VSADRLNDPVVISGPDERAWIDEGGVGLPAWTVEVVVERVWTRSYWFQTLQGAERFIRELDGSSQLPPSSGGTTSP
jgi:hypothetical protein